MTAIRAVVDDFVNRILAGERVNGWFAHAASSPEVAATYKAKLADFIQRGCQHEWRAILSRGPRNYDEHKRGPIQDSSERSPESWRCLLRPALDTGRCGVDS
jgi:hypothetical protein